MTFLQFLFVLHCVLLGPTNKLIDDLVSAKDEMVKVMGEKCSDELKNYDFLKEISKLYIVREAYQGKTFEGNQCRKILKNIENLNIPTELNPFKNALKSLYTLVKLCYKQELPEESEYSSIINHFKSDYLVLVRHFNVSVSNKLHIIFDHLKDYFDGTKLSLVKTSDELIESMHQFVHRRLVRSGYHVKDVLNPLHGRNLYRCILHINSYNVFYDNANKDDE